MRSKKIGSVRALWCVRAGEGRSLTGSLGKEQSVDELGFYAGNIRPTKAMVSCFHSGSRSAVRELRSLMVQEKSWLICKPQTIAADLAGSALFFPTVIKISTLVETRAP